MTPDESYAGSRVAGGVLSAIREIIGRNPALILPQSGLEKDLGIDSLEFVRLVQIIEEEVDIRLDDEAVARVVTVDDLVMLAEVTVRKSAG